VTDPFAFERPGAARQRGAGAWPKLRAMGTRGPRGGTADLSPLQKRVALILAREKLREAVKQLLARYPSVRIIEANIGIGAASRPQQTVRFQAPLAELRLWGLVTPDMLSQPAEDALGFAGQTSLGDGFVLCNALDARSRPGCWDLVICTGALPLEPPDFSLEDARRLIARCAKSA
jgi:hypothetical protein